ncbi:DCN1-like protein 5 [Cyclospora cayetanensis]|uniref:DCN1-like protein 5 n=2 Tax=Cyclospora cayetanensis TaxID=88456 RepID=A0A6P5WCB6_9EIME|nr:DCN1-like protein 5 [Cyclospora cayetanensis]OEH74014.1 hypothetical protein cyc_01740 [Cyclospora cayetanensis]
MLPSNQRHSCAIQQLQDITGCTKKAATELLRQNNFNLERTIDSFYSLSAERRRIVLGHGTEVGRVEGPSRVDEKKIAEFFDAYAVADPTGSPSLKAIKEGGLERLSDHLDVGLDDVFFLVFAFHCGCRTQGVITRDDFFRGLKSLGLDTLTALKDSVQTLRKALFDDLGLLRKVYSYAFTYSLEPMQKQLPTELAIAYWRLLIEPLNWCLFSHFLQYIECISNLSSVTKDAWLMVLEFALTSQAPAGIEATAEDNIDRALQEYEDDGAWPLVIDNFVDWMREERGNARQH